MGCSATKNLAVETVDSTAVKQIRQKRERLNSCDAIPEIIGPDLQNELLDSVKLSNVHKTQHGLSFEIAFDEDKREAQHKMPPKKMESAENKQTKATGADLQVKQDEAEIRRQQILQQRIQSAKMRNNLKKQSSVTSMEDEQSNLLKVPEDTGFINKFSVSAS